MFMIYRLLTEIESCMPVNKIIIESEYPHDDF